MSKDAKAVATTKSADKILNALSEKMKDNTLAPTKERWPCGMTGLSRGIGGGIPRGRFIEIHGPEGGGKSLAWDEPVLTPLGWVRISDLKTGDAVMAGDGSITSVKGVFPQGELPVFRVTFDDGTYSRCSKDHLWKFRDTESKSLNKTWRVMPIQEIRERFDGTTRMGIRRIVIPTGIPAFNARPLPMRPYLLGALLGNGCFTEATMSISVGDAGVREAVAEDARHHGCCLVLADKTAYRITQRGAPTHGTNSVTKAIRAFGLHGHESHEKFIPEMYFTASPAARHALLQGLLDTDGTADKKGKVSFSSASERLANGVATLVRSLGGHAVQRVKLEVFFHHKGERRRGMPAHIVSIRMPGCFPPFMLARKLGRVRPNLNSLDRRIASITQDGSERCVCIAVAHASKTYITRDYLVTHNSSLIGELIRDVADAEAEELALPMGKRIVVMDHEGVMDLEYMEAITRRPWGHVESLADISEVWREYPIVYMIPPYFEFDAKLMSFLLRHNRIIMSAHDSVAAMTPKALVQDSKGAIIDGCDDAAPAQIARLTGKWFPRWKKMCVAANATAVYTNHAKKASIGHQGGPFTPAPWITVGGENPKFYADIRIRCVGGKSDLYAQGKKVYMEVIKNKTSRDRHARLQYHITGVNGYDRMEEVMRLVMQAKILRWVTADGKKFAKEGSETAHHLITMPDRQPYSIEEARVDLAPGGPLRAVLEALLPSIDLTKREDEE